MSLNFRPIIDRFHGTAPEPYTFEPLIQTKLYKIHRLGWSRIKWADNFTLLHWACRKNRLDLVRFLLEKAPFRRDIEAFSLRDGKGKLASDYSKTGSQVQEYFTMLRKIYEDSVLSNRFQNSEMSYASGTSMSRYHAMKYSQTSQGGSPQHGSSSSNYSLSMMADGNQQDSSVDLEVFTELNAIIQGFVEPLMQSDESVPKQAENLMDRIAKVQIYDNRNGSVVCGRGRAFRLINLIYLATKDESTSSTSSDFGQETYKCSTVIESLFPPSTIRNESVTGSNSIVDNHIVTNTSSNQHIGFPKGKPLIVPEFSAYIPSVHGARSASKESSSSTEEGGPGTSSSSSSGNDSDSNHDVNMIMDEKQLLHTVGKSKNLVPRDYKAHQIGSVPVLETKSRAATLDRIIHVRRPDRDLGLILGLSGTHVIGFANKRLIHDFELGDQIVGVNGVPVGSALELTRAVYIAFRQGQRELELQGFELGQEDEDLDISNSESELQQNNQSNSRRNINIDYIAITMKFAVKRGQSEILLNLSRNGYLSKANEKYLLLYRKDMGILCAAALKHGLSTLPTTFSENRSYILGECCCTEGSHRKNNNNDQRGLSQSFNKQLSRSQSHESTSTTKSNKSLTSNKSQQNQSNTNNNIDSTNILNGIFGQLREIRVDIEFLPGRPRNMGLELAQGSTMVRKFALNTANCRYFGNNYFVDGDVIVSLGGINVSTDWELKQAYDKVSQVDNFNQNANLNAANAVNAVAQQVRNRFKQNEMSLPGAGISAPYNVENATTFMPFVVKRDKTKILPGLDLDYGAIHDVEMLKENNSTVMAAAMLNNVQNTNSRNKSKIQYYGSDSNLNSQRPIKREYINYGPNRYNIRTYLTVNEVRNSLGKNGAIEYKNALDKVILLGWNQTAFDRGYTLLHWAARCGDVELCRFFIAAFGADPTARDDRGMSPKDHARRKGHKKIVYFLEHSCRC